MWICTSYIAVFLNRRAAARYQDLSYRKKNLQARGLTKVENHWYIAYRFEKKNIVKQTKVSHLTANEAGEMVFEAV
jgi:hypothetical protein